MTDKLIGRLIAGKYAVKERLGSGGMGAVYRARHEATGGDVAIKFLHGTAALDDHAVKRFQLEAQNAAQLRSTHTIRVVDFGVDDGVFYLVMEYLAGRPLNVVIRDDGPLPWPRVVHIARQVLKSLWEAHEHGRQIV
ncbi:MAG: protein kinase, partial [Myxococcales bacterium]|nr:protein kinase [Myxococcales bacterium]